MLIRKQGRLVKLVRVETSKGPATAARSHQRSRGRRHVVGSFRIDEPMPAGLLEALTREERRTLACWMAVYREDEARARALPVLAGVPAQFDGIITALEAAADTLSVEEADRLWTQLKAIARTLKRAGHTSPRAARRASAAPPGQRDFFGEMEAIEARAQQRESAILE